VAFANDKDMYCVPCAEVRYGHVAVGSVIEGAAGDRHYTDDEGNPLNMVLHGAIDLHGMVCGRCGMRLCDEECSCYRLPDSVEALLTQESEGDMGAFEVSVCIEQREDWTLEALQEVVVVKQQVIERMRRYHLCTLQEEREIDQIQRNIERLLMK
jgi:hypothetical protein